MTKFRPLREMKIVLLGPAASIHMCRWAQGVAAAGHEVHVISQHPSLEMESLSSIASVTWLPAIGEAGYVLNCVALKKAIRRIRPDILNAHYASGYGTLAGLVGFRPYMLSVWGSDVFAFPYESWLKGRLLRWNLRRADRIASTSHFMAKQVMALTPDLRTEICVTPFGVDTSVFRPLLKSATDKIVVGTVKSLADTYGIDILIRAFAEVRQDSEVQRTGKADQMRLLVVGDGPRRQSLEALARNLQIGHVTEFVGAVEHSTVSGWLNRFDIFVAASRQESFGVAVLEASACGLPVVVSDAGGLPEVVDDGCSGFVVRREQPDLLAERIKQLVLDAELRDRLGKGGRRFVLQHFEWQLCVEIMLDLYRQVIGVRAEDFGSRGGGG